MSIISESYFNKKIEEMKQYSHCIFKIDGYQPICLRAYSFATEMVIDSQIVLANVVDDKTYEEYDNDYEDFDYTLAESNCFNYNTNHDYCHVVNTKKFPLLNVDFDSLKELVEKALCPLVEEKYQHAIFDLQRHKYCDIDNFHIERNGNRLYTFLDENTIITLMKNVDVYKDTTRIVEVIKETINSFETLRNKISFMKQSGWVMLNDFCNSENVAIELEYETLITGIKIVKGKETDYKIFDNPSNKIEKIDFGENIKRKFPLDRILQLVLNFRNEESDNA